MRFFQQFIIFCSCYLVSSDIFSSLHHRTKRNTKSAPALSPPATPATVHGEKHTDYAEISVYDSTKPMTCTKYSCTIITEFSVNKEVPRKCEEENIAIVWKNPHPSNETKVLSGFLSPDGSLANKQKTGKNCQLIRR